MMHLINDSDAKRYNRPQMRLVNKESLRKDTRREPVSSIWKKREKRKRERKRRRDPVASLGDEVRSCRLGRKENGRRRERRTPREEVRELVRKKREGNMAGERMRCVWDSQWEEGEGKA